MTFLDQLVDAIPTLTRFARSLTRNRSEAEDLLQDTLERALMKQDLCVDKGSFLGWLRTMMHNLFIDRVRSSTRRNNVEGVTLDEAQSSSSMPSAQEDHRFLTELAPLLGQLPRDGGKIIVAIALEGHSYNHTAARFNVPSGTIRSRLWRSREALSRAALFSAPNIGSARTHREPTQDTRSEQRLRPASKPWARPC